MADLAGTIGVRASVHRVRVAASRETCPAAPEDARVARARAVSVASVLTERGVPRERIELTVLAPRPREDPCASPTEHRGAEVYVLACTR